MPSRLVAAEECLRKLVAQIVRHVQIEIAVVVEIAERGARPEARVADARDRRDVLERSIAVVTIQPVLSEAS